MTPLDDAARRVAFWAAIACAVTSIAYVLAQLLEWQGALGSAGGPESASTPIGIALLLTPSHSPGLGRGFLLMEEMPRTPATNAGQGPQPRPGLYAARTTSPARNNITCQAGG